jgi:hypothetical protein
VHITNAHVECTIFSIILNLLFTPCRRSCSRFHSCNPAEDFEIGDLTLPDIHETLDMHGAAGSVGADSRPTGSASRQSKIARARVMFSTGRNAPAKRRNEEEQI